MATPIPPNFNQDIEDLAAITENTFRVVADNIQNIFKDALDQGANISTSLGNDVSNNLKSLARQSVTSINNQNKLNGGALKQADIQKQIEARLFKINSIENQINSARMAGIAIDAKVEEDLRNVISLNDEYIRQLTEQGDIVRRSADDVNTRLGFTPKLLAGLDKSLSKLGIPELGFKIALEETHKLRQIAEETGTPFSVLGTYTSQVGTNLKETLSSANLLQLGGAMLIESFFKLDSMVGNTSKNLGISYKSSLSLNSSFTSIAAESNNIFTTTKGINESFNQINQTLGTNGSLSADILTTQTELVKQAGYSVEAATMLSKLSLATGKPTKDIAANFIGSAKALNLVNGTAINEKQLLEDISGLSKDTLATFAAQPGKLAEASYEAKRLGLDLEKLKGTQSSLLDIESSIASEFEAEVLTGRQLNLEKARFFALTNDYAGLAKELAAQDVTRDSFSKMNVIQQEATAKALGMSANTMGGMLVDQEAMTRLTGIEGNNAKEKFNNLVKQVGMEEAKKRLGNETLAQQMESASVQDRFTASIEKLKEAFVGLMTPIMPILDAFTTLIALISESKSAILALQVLMAGLATKAIVTAIASIFTGSAVLGPLGIAAAVAGTAGMVALMSSTTQTVQDGTAPASKGPFTITDRFGATAITTQGDNIAVSPNLSRGSQPSQQIVSIDYDKMAQALSKVQVNTNIDGVQISNQLFNKSFAGMAIRKV